MRKLILFDWGNVLLDSDSDKYNIFDARKDIISELQPEDEFRLSGVFRDEKFWTSCKESLNICIEYYLQISGCDCTVAEFKECYLKYYRKVPWFNNMISLVDELAVNPEVRVGILSSLCEMDLELLKGNIQMDNLDYRFFTFDLGIQKPDIRLHNLIESVTGCSRNNILYIDDSERNIRLAKEKEWGTILATGKDYEKIKKMLLIFCKSVI